MGMVVNILRRQFSESWTTELKFRRKDRPEDVLMRRKVKKNKTASLQR